jgi:hypothetical protein
VCRGCWSPLSSPGPPAPQQHVTSTHQRCHRTGVLQQCVLPSSQACGHACLCRQHRTKQHSPHACRNDVSLLEWYKQLERWRLRSAPPAAEAVPLLALSAAAAATRGLTRARPVLLAKLDNTPERPEERPPEERSPGSGSPLPAAAGSPGATAVAPAVPMVSVAASSLPGMSSTRTA